MIYVAVIIILLFLLYFIFVGLKKIILEKLKTSIIFSVIACLLVVLSIVYIFSYFNVFENKDFLSYMEDLKSFSQYMILFLLISFVLYIMIGFLGKRYTLRVENFNIGGINVFFDKSNEIFIKTVGTFIKSKRSLFYFNKERDNIRDVLNTYYKSYDFVRSNLELLDSEVDSDLYTASIDLLKKLNEFLTKHQSDYRRWYEKVVEDDIIEINRNNKIVVHKTTIEKVQEQYYRYDEILKDIQEVNNYMKSNELRKIFNIEHFDWEGEI